MFSRNKLALAYCNISNPNDYRVVKWISPTYEIIFESTYPVHFRFKSELSTKKFLKVKGFVPFSYKTTISFDKIYVMHPNGTTAQYTHDSEYHVENGVYEIIRTNFGDPNLVKISFHAEKNIELDDHVLKYVFGKSPYEAFRFSFYIYGEDPNYISVNCNKTLPCNIIVRKKS